MNTSRTLEQLEATKWTKPPPDATNLVQRCYALRKLPVEQLTSADLRVLIGQEIGLRYLMPVALGLLRTEPMLEAEYYPGDLLAAAMRVGPEYWQSASREREELAQVARKAQAAIEQDCASNLQRQIAKDIAAYLAQSAA